MPDRRRSSPKPTTRTVEIGVRVFLTAGEVSKLRDRAAADLRSVASYVAWLLVQELEQPAGAPRPVRGASARDRRAPHSINRRLSLGERTKLRSRAKAEARSVSGYVGRVIVEALVRD